MRDCVETVDRTINWKWLPELADWIVEQGLAIQRIPAPTFYERPRAAYVAEQLAALGAQQVETDALANVYGLLPGANPAAPGIMVSAHTDTIFAADTDLSGKQVNDTIYAPGLGDNSIGVAGMLGLAALLQREQLQPACDIWLVATAREEGLGNLGGMRAAFERLRTRIAAVINLEGLAFGHIYNGGIAVRRLRIAATAPGGHSWLHFGRPSAIHAIMQLGAHITAIHPRQTPRTTYNIGMIEGGEAINAIATHAALWLDLRSEERQALDELETCVRAQVERLAQPDLSYQIEVVGDRPAGYLAPEHPLVQGALAALGKVGIRGTLESGSTDGNVPLAAAFPAVTIGITRGGNAHRLDEFIELGPIVSGSRQFVTLALAAALSQTS